MHLQLPSEYSDKEAEGAEGDTLCDEADQSDLEPSLAQSAVCGLFHSTHLQAGISDAPIGDGSHTTASGLQEEDRHVDPDEGACDEPGTEEEAVGRIKSGSETR